MSPSARKLNFMIRDEIARELEALVPAGERSRTVNDALAKELLSIRRRKITLRLRAARGKGPALGTEKIVAALRRNRGRDGE
ncbi:MAG: hypothetical protein A3K53_06660 [Deltaproteobacteria bacterium RIFOXYB2_FULL_66_7]|nr:MAG: hypothetical protein A3K53_06660 [Deltaproteobacteria bacterium RIFOXYB2_FULL_66_7]